ncbi:DUF3549 family protein [Aestuariibacter sp. A3R04]|uniref:DUF3549 family protein n=1 Tax=Aestuariibacter sp. A3R04 TaxID=2841571 RepID=UPI001C086C66|nr:DUF3549 family protein [Aestuariibacter sp. A3R04]MBU3022112.1 DUF3549 family protein [Aestuariibacter sp. A3R04]
MLWSNTTDLVIIALFIRSECKEIMSGRQQHTITTLSEFLLHAGTNFQFFDLGRGVHIMESQAFLDLENGLTPCPRPRQQHAWFAIVFWSGKPVKQHYIWFVKFPVDERGLLVVAARNHFLQIIIDALGQSVEGRQAEKLPDNPYSFIPTQSQMAQFSAITKAHLSLPLSSGVSAVAQYVAAPAITDWRQLSIQAVADFSLSMSTGEHDNTLQQNLTSFQPDFAKTLLESCENVPLTATFKAFLGLFIRERFEKAPTLTLAALRAMSSHEKDPAVRDTLSDLLARPQLDIDTLSVIAGRHYDQLSSTQLVTFFEHAARLDERDEFNGKLFTGFFSDLVQIPAIREHVLGVLRSPHRSERLARAFGRLFTQHSDKQS